MNFYVSIVVILGLCIGIYCDKVSYENYRVYSVRLENESQAKILEAFESWHDDLIFLTSPSTQIATDIIVPPQKLAAINAFLSRYALDFEIKTENLQK